MPTDPRSSAAVGRLYGALTEALARRGGTPAADVTVSEIYQTLVPYARARAELGFEMNADYEHALMRLIAGEGGYARLEQPEARAQVARELESPHPDVTLYRRFAASNVRLSAVASPSPSPPASDGPPAPPARAPTEASEPAAASRYVSLSEADRARGTSTATGGVAGPRAPVAGGARAESSAPAGGARAESSPAAGGARAESSVPAKGARAEASPPAFDEGTWGQALERVAEDRSRPPGSAAADGAREPLEPSGGEPDSGRDEGGGEAELAVRAERALDHGLARLSTLLEGSGADDPRDGDGNEGASDAASAPRAATRPEACGSCGKRLPSDRDARFCPYCGSEQPTVCAACGDDLEPDWRYCPSCGAEA